MRRTTYFVAVTFFVGLAIGFFARGVRTDRVRSTDTLAADLAAIGRLHQADIEATLKQDVSAMTDLWSEDGVKVDVPGGPVVGRKAMHEVYEKFRLEYPEFRVLKYMSDMKAVQIADGWAIEVSDSEATYKMSAKDSPVTVPKARGMRVLKRQTDGSWKFALVGLK